MVCYLTYSEDKNASCDVMWVDVGIFYPIKEFMAKEHYINCSNFFFCKVMSFGCSLLLSEHCTHG